MVGALTEALHASATVTLQHLRVYDSAAHATADRVDECLRSLSALVAKCEELERTLGPAEATCTQMYAADAAFASPARACAAR